MPKLRELRESLNLSAIRLCSLSGVSNKRISGHERGSDKLTVDERVKIYRALNSEVQRLKTLVITPDALGFD